MEKNLADIPHIICEEYGYKEHDPASLSPLTLAFIGDTIFDLIVRTKVIERGNAPVNKLHRYASNVVNAAAQAEIVEKIKDNLTEEEYNIWRRGRNAKSYTSAKNASIKDYKSATGLEALLGWLYLDGKMDRILELILPVVSDEKDAVGKDDKKVNED